MSNTEILNDATDLICGLKAAATFLECQHNAFLKHQQAQAAQKEPSAYMMVPICDDNIKHVPRNKLKKCKSQPTSKKNDSEKREECPQKYKSPEMKMGYLHYKCFCLHRNGLQDECPLTTCQGQPECLVKPWPVCPPGKYFRARNPELYPPMPKSKSKC